MTPRSWDAMPLCWHVFHGRASGKQKATSASEGLRAWVNSQLQVWRAVTSAEHINQLTVMGRPDSDRSGMQKRPPGHQSCISFHISSTLLKGILCYSFNLLSFAKPWSQGSCFKRHFLPSSFTVDHPVCHHRGGFLWTSGWLTPSPTLTPLEWLIILISAPGRRKLKSIYDY